LVFLRRTRGVLRGWLFFYRLLLLARNSLRVGNYIIWRGILDAFFLGILGSLLCIPRIYALALSDIFFLNASSSACRGNFNSS